MKLLPARLCLLLAGLVLTSACSNNQTKKVSTPAPQALAPVVKPEPTPATAPPVQAQTAPVEAPKQDPAVALIAEAEKAYEAGVGDYQAGHLDAAKQDFNRAVDTLMSGPVDVKSDDRLQREFDKITGEIHKLEMEAFKQGDGFTEQQAEPAPIDEANAVTFPVDVNVKARAEAELKTTQSDLPLIVNDHVASYINYFSTRGRDVFEQSLARSGRYREMIMRVFREEGVPQDLIYLAQAESGFHPLALSRVGARGMWQFMADRGADYGLQRNWWVDQRQDPEKSTRAAARHLKDLYAEFGDWYLAMAAYNSGPGNVQQAVKRTGYADFWELYNRDVLPQETKNYVPIILAMTVMSKNPGQYGLTHIVLDAPEKYDEVAVNYPVDLRLVAECVDAPVERLVSLNPSLLRGTTPKDQIFELRLPQGAKEQYESSIRSIPADKRVLWRYHKVEAGDTLFSLAKKYHTTEKAIASANGLASQEVELDSRLVIPVTAAQSGAVAYSKHPTRYQVRKGDTVLSIADDFGVSPERLRRWNRLKGNQLTRGRFLVIYKPLAPGQEEHVASHRSSARHQTASTHSHTTKKTSARSKSVAHKKSTAASSNATLAARSH